MKKHNNKLMRSVFAVLMCMSLCTLVACFGNARTSIHAPNTKFQVSMSPVLNSTPKIVGKFAKPFTAWSMAYGLAQLDPKIDLSEAINQQVAMAGGNSIINLKVETQACLINGAPILSLLPVWPSCVEGMVTGDIAHQSEQ